MKLIYLNIISLLIVIGAKAQESSCHSRLLEAYNKWDIVQKPLEKNTMVSYKYSVTNTLDSVEGVVNKAVHSNIEMYFMNNGFVCYTDLMDIYSNEKYTINVDKINNRIILSKSQLNTSKYTMSGALNLKDTLMEYLKEGCEKLQNNRWKYKLNDKKLLNYMGYEEYFFIVNANNNYIDEIYMKNISDDGKPTKETILKVKECQIVDQNSKFANNHFESVFFDNKLKLLPKYNQYKLINYLNN